MRATRERMRVIVMFLRFIVVVPQAHTSFGLFRSDLSALHDASLPDWLRSAIEEQYDWFNAHLPIPNRLSVMSRGRRIYAGLCWFRPEACKHIARARELAWLLGEAGQLTRTLKAHDPGQVLYRDDFQIVAKPERGMPSAH